MTPSENHNRLAPELTARLIKETGGESEAMVVLESVILGVMMFYAPTLREASEFLDSMTIDVIERMKGI